MAEWRKRNDALGTVNRGDACESGLCTLCMSDCKGKCETWLSSLLGRELLYPREFGWITSGSGNTSVVGTGYHALRIHGYAYGARGLGAGMTNNPDDCVFPNVNIETSFGNEIETKCRVPMMTGALGEGKAAQAAQFSEHVIRFVAEQVRTNVRELQGAMLKLVAFAALQNEKITLSVAQAVLAEHIERCDPIVHVSDIETTVAGYFGTTASTMHSAKKDRTVALARHFSMYLTRKHTKMSSSEIGRAMGNKNHATVLVACKKIEGLLERNEEVNWQGPNGNKVVKARAVVLHLEDSIAR